MAASFEPAVPVLRGHVAERSGAAAYRPDIDGLRAFAVLAVVLFHAARARGHGGFVGVDIFFVISGFLITRDVLERAAVGDFSLLRFYARRARRLFPALICVLLATLAAGSMLLFHGELLRLFRHAFASVFFVENFQLRHESGYFDSQAHLKPLLHLWSLAIEEQFYLLWPLLLLVTRQRPWWPAVGVVLASFVANIVLSRSDPAAAYLLPSSRFWQIGTGALLAIRTPRCGRFTELVAIAGACICASSVALLTPEGYPGWYSLAPTVGAALLIAAGSRSLVARQLGRPWLAAAGRLSYPLYLWHWPALAFLHIASPNPSPAQVAGALGFAVVATVITHRFVERPLRARGDRTALVLAAVLVSIGLAVALPRPGPVTRIDQEAGDLEIPTLAGFQPCLPSMAGIADCAQSGAHPTAVLVGDSHARMLFAALASLDGKTAWRLVSKSSCPPLLGVKVSIAGVPCGTAVDDALRRIAADPDVRLVVISFYGGYIHGAEPSIGAPFGHAENKIQLQGFGLSDRAAIVQAGLDGTVALLQGAGKRVIVMIDVPELPFYPRDCLARPLLQPPVASCELALAAAWRDQGPMRSTIADVQSRHPAMEVWDTLGVLCPGGRCLVERDGMLVYSDRHHLSARGSRLVAADLVRRLDARAAAAPVDHPRRPD